MDASLITALKNLTAMLSILSFVLSVLVLVDCMFLYKRITVFLRKQQKPEK